MNFNIDDLESSVDVTFNLDVGKRDDGSPVGFVLLGPNSAAYSKADRAIQLLNLKDASVRDGKPVDTNTDDGAQYVVDGSEQRREIILSHCVTGWYGFTIGESETAEFTPQNFARVLKARPAWARKLVDAIETEANFAVG